MQTAKKINCEDSEKIDAGALLRMPYCDFVGWLNQWNCPPGALSTVEKWRVFSRMDAQSHLVELGCTTGLSSRELRLASGCTGEGVDLSNTAVQRAQENAERFNIDSSSLTYVAESVETFTPRERPTHVLVGAALRFFPNPQKTLARICQWFDQKGYLLAAPFFAHTSVPKNHLETAQQVFGITPTFEGYKDIMRLYRDFEIIYEDRQDLVPESNEELHYYCESTIAEAIRSGTIISNEVAEVARDRLFKIKHMSNVLREYQSYSVLVLRYRKEIYPRRLVELF